jgi:hypothetical protein
MNVAKKKKIYFFLSRRRVSSRHRPPKLHAEKCNGHSGACRKDGVLN